MLKIQKIKVLFSTMTRHMKKSINRMCCCAGKWKPFLLAIKRANKVFLVDKLQALGFGQQKGIETKRWTESYLSNCVQCAYIVSKEVNSEMPQGYNFSPPFCD